MAGCRCKRHENGAQAEPDIQGKAAAFVRLHEPDDARVSSPESVQSVDRGKNAAQSLMSCLRSPKSCFLLPMGGNALPVRVSTLAGTPPWPRRGYRPCRRWGRDRAEGLDAALWRGRLAGVAQCPLAVTNRGHNGRPPCHSG
jgi:hypothetical protein